MSGWEFPSSDDPNAAPLDIGRTKAVVVLPPRKVPVSIRRDADVVDDFRQQGAGYRSRIDAVLRSCVRARERSPRG